MSRQPWRLAVALVAAVLLPAAIAAGPTTITVLHVNDTHSHLDAFGPKDFRLDGTLGGLAKAATLMKEARAHEQNTPFLHAGDALVGDFFFNTTLGVAELSLLKSLGLDAMTVGNHELDNGPDLLTQTLSMVPGGPPAMLSANANTTGCDQHPCAPLMDSIQPSTIIARGGVQIGIFGMTTPDDPTAQPSPVVIEGAPDPPAVIGKALLMALDLRMPGRDHAVAPRSGLRPGDRGQSDGVAHRIHRRGVTTMPCSPRHCWSGTREFCPPASPPTTLAGCALRWTDPVSGSRTTPCCRLAGAAGLTATCSRSWTS